MKTITIPERQVAALNLLDEAIAALRIIREVMMSAETDDRFPDLASLQCDALTKLEFVRHFVNQQHGAGRSSVGL